MELNGFGLINMDDYRLSASRAAAGPQNFEEILRRASARDITENNDNEFPLRRLENRPGREAIDENDRLYQLCLELETFLVKNLLTSMRNTVQKSGLVDEGFAGKMYEDMLYDEYAKDFTRNAGFGLAEQAYRQLKSL